MHYNNDFERQMKECVRSFFELSGIGCELCDASGNAVSTSGYCCSSCDICSSTGLQKSVCLNLHAFTAKASVEEDGRYIYECPLGLSCITSAVVLPEGSLLRLTAGPFLMEDREDFRTYTLEQSLKLSYDNIEPIMQKIDKISILETSEVNAASSILVYCAAFLSRFEEGEDYLSNLESTTLSEWENANSIDPSGIINKAISFIDGKFSEDIRLADIAEHSGVTTSYLCRLFKRNTGITINTFITQKRIEKSREMLKEGLPISEVARLSGFSDQSYFTKVFRQSEGVTPLKYRKSHL